MFTGARISLYPTTDDFVGVILGSLPPLEPYRHAPRVETDDISTLLVGPLEILFPAMRDLYVAAAATRRNCVLQTPLRESGEPRDGDGNRLAGRPDFSTWFTNRYLDGD